MEHNIDVSLDNDRTTAVLTINGVKTTIEDNNTVNLMKLAGKKVEEYLDSKGIKAEDANITINSAKTASVKKPI